jgi:hypothetical protein
MKTGFGPTLPQVRSQVENLVSVPEECVLTKHLPGIQEDLMAGDIAGVSERLALVAAGKEVWDRKAAVAQYAERSRALFQTLGLNPEQLAATFGARLEDLASHLEGQPTGLYRERLNGLSANGVLGALEQLVPSVPVEDFPGLLALAKEQLRDPALKEPDELFYKNLKWMATLLITEGRKYKEPKGVSDDDLKKLEIMRKLHAFDYASEIRISYTTTVDDGDKKNRVSFEKPFWIYLAEGLHDLSEHQAQVIIDRAQRMATDEGTILVSSYGRHPEIAIRVERPSEHLDGKNLLHVLLERPLTENKQRVADVLFEKGFGNTRFKMFGRDASWNAPNSGRYNRHWLYGSRSVLGSAVVSGSPANVRYALGRGSTLSKSGEYLGNEFVDAVRWSREPQSREIVELLMQAAVAAGSPGLLNQPYKAASGEETYPIQYFAREGDLAMVLKLASLGAAVPVKEARSATYRSEGIPLGPTHSANGVPLYPPTTSRTNTEFWIVEMGRESVPYVKQAVFNVDRDGKFYHASTDVFGRALEWLKSQGVLAPEDIPGDDDARFLNFAWSLHHAALEERAKNSDFLSNAGAFTEGFAQAVARRKQETDNFRSASRAPTA